MKSFSAEALAALASGNCIVSGAIWFGGVVAGGFWGGYGNLVIDGRAYFGAGDRSLVQASGGTLGGAEQGAQLSLSGVDPDIAARLDISALRGVPVILHRLIFTGTGSALLHASVYLRGRVDSVALQETPAGTSTLSIGVEGAARGLGRRSERMRTDADQQLVLPGDGGLKRIAYAGDKDIYWGGKPPARVGGALGASYFAGSGATRSDDYATLS